MVNVDFQLHWPSFMNMQDVHNVAHQIYYVYSLTCKAIFKHCPTIALLTILYCACCTSLYLENRDEPKAAHSLGKAIFFVSEAVNASPTVPFKRSFL